MELLSQYVYSSSQSEGSDDELQPAKVSSVYLIAYSQPLILNFITTLRVFFFLRHKAGFRIREGRVHRPDGNSLMMAIRWKAFQFERQIPQNEQLSIQRCARCFVEFI